MALLHPGRAVTCSKHIQDNCISTGVTSPQIKCTLQRTASRTHHALRRHRRFCSSSLTSSVTDSTDEVPLADLQVMLEDAVRQEDYQAAAKLRDELTRRQSDSRSMVEEANRRFYDAFQRNDFKAMNDIWGQGEQVQCIHPAAACIASRKNVMESWRMILRGAPMSISLEDVRIFVSDSMAFVTCIEVMDAGDSRGRTAATNVFEKQNGRWVLVHHHGSPTPVFV
ncbi:probable f-box protein SKIP8 at C-terminar half [Coccomyxa sp. Obi]|nr:probable f-box protein SKIP8 at C-terminar half [Coccomyxa sp. Obi]